MEGTPFAYVTCLVVKILITTQEVTSSNPVSVLIVCRWSDFTLNDGPGMFILCVQKMVVALQINQPIVCDQPINQPIVY